MKVGSQIKLFQCVNVYASCSCYGKDDMVLITSTNIYVQDNEY